MMLNLTRQEKNVLLFLAAALFCGITINYLQKNSPPFNNFIIASSQSAGPQKINLNTAGVQDLVSLPGIGPAIAQRIVDRRANFGNFTTIEDIRKVKGIGERKFEAIKEYLVVSEDKR